MSSFCKAGNFIARAGTGTQAITGLGFQPKGLIIWSQVYAPSALFTNFRFGTVGFSAGTGNDVGSGSAENSPSNPSDVNTAIDIFIIFGKSYLNSGEMIASLQSFDVDGFTLNWASNSFGAACSFNYMAFGGTEVSCKRGAFTSNGLSSQVITGVGFKPKALFGMYSMFDGVSGVDNAAEQFGFSDGSTDGSCFINAKTGISPGSTVRLQKAALFTDIDYTTEAVNAVGRISSFDTDGFTINWTTVGPARDGYYLAIAGISAKVGTITQPAVTGIQSTNVSLPNLLGCMLTGVCAIANSAIQRTANLFRGAFSAASQACDWTGSLDATATSGSTRGQKTTVSVIHATIDNPGTAILNAEASGSFGTTSIQLNWTTVDAIARELLYIAIAQSFIPIVVNAGDDSNALLSDGFDLVGSYTGIASIHTWSLADGPASVTFTNANALSTHVNFTKNGKYLIKLTVDDGINANHTYILITVLDLAALPTANPSL